MDLQHRGIKGQRWGVRRGPPYPIEDTVLKKGTKLNSVSPSWVSELYKKGTEQEGKWLYTYNPEDEWDSKVYKGPFSVYKAQQGWNYLCEHQFETTRDLKMPTKKERVDAFIDQYTNDNKTTVRDLKQVQRFMKSFNVGSKEAQTVNVKKLETETDYEAAYEIFGHVMEDVSRFRSGKAYKKLMETKYDAMVDDNNQGLYNSTHDPIIIFKADQALKVIGDARMMDFDEIESNLNYVRSELNKQGKRMVL